MMIKRRVTPPPAKHIFMVTVIFFLIATVISIIIINEGIKPVLMDIATTRTEQYANKAMGIAVNKRISEDLDTTNLVEGQTNDEGRVVNYIFNTDVENQIQRDIHYRVETFLDRIEKGDIPGPGAPLDVEIEPEEELPIDKVKENQNLLEIPIGQVLGIPLLANLGPTVPVNIKTLGIVSTEITDEFVESGINGAYINILVHIEVEVSVVIPFASAPIKLEQDIPITRIFEPGDVPQYYNKGGNNDPSLSIPIDPLK
ncbi:sporulation protein YunB [Aquibacillus halophilus]|uniref:Sporulation protein YunB n=2 Tax=Aquibacillus halophilus TaxID=930132 RepID=A0A6A8DGC8_9BACI|nr:sporulation protein YunB [Aquibacillus halophilus]